MLNEPSIRTVPHRQPTIRSEVKSTLKLVLITFVLSSGFFGLLTISPYLIDSDCSRLGYTPVTLAQCLPESEVKSTIWEASIPTPMGDIFLVKGEPLAQEIPLLFSLWIVSFPTVVAAHTLGRLVFMKLALSAAQSSESRESK